MSLKEQYYNFIWDCVRNGLKYDNIISLKRYDQVLNYFLKSYKSFSDMPVYIRFYLIVQSFIYTTLDQIIELIINENNLNDLKDYLREILSLLEDLKRDTILEGKEYNLRDYNFKKTLTLIEILKNFINELMQDF